VNAHVWWYAARATGIVGWVLLTASAVWGVALSTRLLGKRPSPAWLLDLHRFLGGLAVVFVGVHVAALVADTYVHFGLREILQPLASSGRPGAVALGVVAAYLLVAVEVTSLLRRRLPAKVWRRVHIASFPLWVASTAHLLTAGTDTPNPVLRGAVVASLTAMAFVTTIRVTSPKPDRSARRPAPRVSPRAGAEAPLPG
jgi:DMSO/TMAO reductase YedYZ heme-binding membrane subunit